MNFYEKQQEDIIKKIDEEFNTCGFDSAQDFLWIYVMHGCGCGNSEKLAEDFYIMFESIANKNDHTYKYIYKDKYNELIAQMLDSRGLLEHGTSIGGSWLSKSGQHLYNLLKNYNL